MNRYILVSIIALVVLVGGIYMYSNSQKGKKEPQQTGGHGATNHTRKSHVAFITIALAILAVFILHVVAATSLFKAGVGASLINNPLLYVMIVLMLVIVPFKLKHLLGFIYSKKKNNCKKYDIR